MTFHVPWFEKAFGEDYLTVYRRRSPEVAVAEVAATRDRLGLTGNERILDLACGAGRHSHLFAEAGLFVIGMDLSPDLLAVASRGPGAYVRGDMRRLPFATGFDAVTMFFTSFGYFADDAENEAVLREVARVLRLGGQLLLDYVNRDVVIEGLVPESEETIEGSRIQSRRSITLDGRRVEKEVRIERPDGSCLEYTESVRLYTSDELRTLLEDVGIEIVAAPTEPDPARLVLVGRLSC